MIEVGPWYVRVWMPEHATTTVSFEAAQAVAWENDTPAFARRSTLPEHFDNVSDLTEAQPHVRGSVRFDGGMHVYFGDEEGYLFGDPSDFIGLGPLFERVHEEAARLFDAADTCHWLGG
ncbi:MAG: hypothetical protein MUF64_32300 [Polyangiaceae bacterium]|jgi:hypothetical protein|nr:hypothetical protein [Polyangiaceae bacterium]